MGLLTHCFVPRGGFLYTMIVPGGGFMLPSSRVPGEGMVQCGEGIKEFIFQIFTILKITDMLSSNHHLSLYTKLMTELDKEDWQSIK